MELDEEGGVFPRGTMPRGVNTLNGVEFRPGAAGSEPRRQTFTNVNANSMLLRAGVSGEIGQQLLESPCDSYSPNLRERVERRSRQSGVVCNVNLGQGNSSTNEFRVEVLEAECTSLRKRNLLLQKQVKRLKIENHVQDDQMAGFRNKVIELDAMLTELRASNPPIGLPAALVAVPPVPGGLLVCDDGGGVSHKYPASSDARTKEMPCTRPSTQCLGVAPTADGVFNGLPRRDVKGQPDLRALSCSRGQVTSSCRVSAGNGMHPVPLPVDRSGPAANATVARADAPPIMETPSLGCARLRNEAGRLVVDSSPLQMSPESEVMPGMARAIGTRLLTGRGKPMGASLQNTFHRFPPTRSANGAFKCGRGRVKEPLGAAALAGDAPASGGGVKAVTMNRATRQHPLKDFWADNGSSFDSVQGSGADFVEEASAVGRPSSSRPLQRAATSAPPSSPALAGDAPASGGGVKAVTIDPATRQHPLKDFWADNASCFDIVQGSGADFVQETSAVGTPSSSRPLQRAATSAPPASSEQPVEGPRRSSPPPEPRDVGLSMHEGMVTERIEVSLRSLPTTEGKMAENLPARNGSLLSLPSIDATPDEGSSDSEISLCVDVKPRREDGVRRGDAGSSDGTNVTSSLEQCTHVAAVARVESRPRLRVCRIGTPRRASTRSRDTHAVTATIREQPTRPGDATNAAPAAGVGSGATIATVRATPLIRLVGDEVEDMESRYTHVTVCAYCCSPTNHDAPIGLCEECPRTFCISCLREDMQRADPVAPDVHVLEGNGSDVCVKQCAWCVRCNDVELPPPAADAVPMEHLLEQLLRHDLSRLFRTPVDIDEHPDYVESIGRCSMMDLGTMVEKLEGRKYPRRRGPGQFLEDLSRIWRNCRKFAGCDELGQPHYGTAVPGIVRCALVLEAMATKYCTTHISEHEGTVWPETAWDFYRQKTQRANEEARLMRLERRGDVEETEALPAGGTAIEMPGNTIPATEELPTNTEHPVGDVRGTSPSMPDIAINSSNEHLPNKRSRTAMEEVVIEAAEIVSGYGEDDAEPRRESGPSRSGDVLRNVGRAGPWQQPLRFLRAEGVSLIEAPVRAATATALSKNVSDRESSSLASHSEWSVLHQLCDVATAFAKSRTSQILR